MGSDIGLTLRALRREKGPFLVAALCVGLGIGVNVALFGLVDALLLRPPPGVEDSPGLVRIRIGSSPGDASRGAGSTATFVQYQAVAAEWADVLADVAAYGQSFGSLGGGPEARLASMLVVTDSYFSTLGVTPAVGRFFEPLEGAKGAAIPVAVVSHGYWTETLGGGTDVIGRSIQVNGRALDIVGVAPEGFNGVDLGAPDIWVPMGLVELPEFGGPFLYGPGAGWLQLIGRLAPGVTVTQASARALEAAGPVDPFVPVSPSPDGVASQAVGVEFRPLRTMFFADQLGRSPLSSWTLAIPAAVLLLACATVANLLLAQNVKRRRDVALRLALGGSIRDILRARAVESGVIALTGAAFAVGVVRWSPWAFLSLPIPPLPDVVSWRTIWLALVLAVATPLLFGAVPAAWAASQPVSNLLRSDCQGGTVGVARLQGAFMTIQTAITFILLLAAILFLSSFQKAQRVQTGLDIDRLLVASVDARATLRGIPASSMLVNALGRIRDHPEVDAADVAGMVPFFLLTRRFYSVVEGQDASRRMPVLFNAVGPEFFRTVGIDVLRGRGFEPSDTEGGTAVAVVSEALASQLRAGASALGMCLTIPGASQSSCVEVIGVAEDAKYDGLFGEPSPVLYVPAAQVLPTATGSHVFIRTVRDASLAGHEVQRSLQTLDPEMPFVQVEPLSNRVRPQRIQWEIASKLFAAFGLLATVLAAVGLYMVVAFRVAQRARELGIKSALGANKLRLMGEVLVSAVRTSAQGLVIGALFGAVLAIRFQRLLYQTSPLAVPAYLLVAAVLLVISCLASLPPAFRASRAEPAVVLQEA